MSNWLAGFIGAVIGSALSLLMLSIASVTRWAERENSIYREGFAEGHRIGLRKGKALQRVDVAPGPDSIRPDAKTTCPVVTSYNISNAQIRHIFDAYLTPKLTQEVPHDL